MMLLSLFVIVASVAMATLQTTTGAQSIQRQPLDRIYFTDINGRIQAFDSVTTAKKVDVQKSVEVNSQVDQNYLQTIPPSTTPESNLTPLAIKQVNPVKPGSSPLYGQFQSNFFFNDPNAYGPRPTSHGATAQGPLQNILTTTDKSIQPYNDMTRAPLGQLYPQRGQADVQPFYDQNRSQAAASQVQPIRTQIPIFPQQERQVPLQTDQFAQPSFQSTIGNTPPSKAISYFGLNILKNINSPMRNVVISPFSITTLLALLQQGAQGATQQQINAALQMMPDYSAAVFKSLYDNLQKRNSRNILRVANNLFVADAFDLNKDFKMTASRQFASEVTPTKFYQTDASQRINHWVAVNTNNKIDKIFGPGDIGENTQMVLVNAIYFKGLWAVKFKPEVTDSREFHYRDGSKKLVPFMHSRQLFRTGFDTDFGAQVLCLPFENDYYSLMVILPSPQGSVDTLLASLTTDKLEQYKSFQPRDVVVGLPKFTVRSDVDLTPLLRKMGITSIFSDQAELSGLGMFRTNSPQVSTAIHSATLSIDEEGGTAAAASAVSAVALSYDYDPTAQFTANRPFLAIIWDNQASFPLFMARIESPA